MDLWTLVDICMAKCLTKDNPYILWEDRHFSLAWVLPPFPNHCAPHKTTTQTASDKRPAHSVLLFYNVLYIYIYPSVTVRVLLWCTPFVLLHPGTTHLH